MFSKNAYLKIVEPQLSTHHYLFTILFYFTELNSCCSDNLAVPSGALLGYILLVSYIVFEIWLVVLYILPVFLVEKSH